MRSSASCDPHGIIEPTSKADSLRVIEETGTAPLSYQGLIMSTVNEFRRLFDALLLTTRHMFSTLPA